MHKEELDINYIFILIFIILLVVVAMLVFLFVTFNNRKNKLIQEQLKIALEHQQKSHTLELRALRGQMNPHFIHNSLNAIQYYIQQNDVESSENYLSKFSKLMRLFFEYSRRQSILISEEVILLENYLQIEKLRFEEKLTYKIIVDPKLDSDEEQIPSMMLQPIVENAVNHGLFHKKGNGYIKIEFRYIDETSFEVSILDNGIGINKSLKMETSIIKNRGQHSTSVLEERLKLLKESKQWNIDYSITDCSEKSTETGTEVKLIFKTFENEDKNNNNR